MVLCTALTAIVLGVMATMYGFVTVRLSDAYTSTAMYDQVNSVADRIEATIRNAHNCTLDGAGNLKCQMPKKGIDTDGDGYNDAYYPDKTDNTGTEQYSPGNTVWFYDAGSDGTYNSGSNYVWRAETPGSNPTSATLDKSFGYYYNGQIRYPLADSTTFTITPATHLVTFTVTGSTRIGNESSISSGSSADSGSRIITVTRSVTWRNYN